MTDNYADTALKGSITQAGPCEYNLKQADVR